MPRVATRPDFRDRAGQVLTRTGIIRNNYKITPGLYAAGTPDGNAPVLVTANYKLSFDTLRFSLQNVDCWILVADTRGINVWCAAGKGTFSTSEIVNQVGWTKLSELVSHRELIVPQLGATGVSGPEVKKQCGFRVRFGPVRATDIERYLVEKKNADEGMRSVTFTLRERVELIPVELYLQLKILGVVFLAGFLLSGIGPHFYAIDVTAQRTLQLFWATLVGLAGGSVVVPSLLPYLPGRQFWVKGLWPPLLFFLLYLLFSEAAVSLEFLALLCWAVSYSSFQAMNFTGCTPYTSPSGVEFEMRRGIPVQACLAGLAVVMWIAAPFFV